MSTSSETNPAAAIDGLLRWWHRKFGPVKGQRNANTYVLAAAFNNYGIPYSEALAACLRNVDNDPAAPFTATEINDIVVSAYRRTEHGVKQWRTGAGDHPQTTAPSRRYSAEQRQALAERIAARFMQQSKVWEPAPPPQAEQQEHTPSPLERLLARHPAISLLVDEVELDLSRATFTTL